MADSPFIAQTQADDGLEGQQFGIRDRGKGGDSSASCLVRRNLSAVILEQTSSEGR